MEIRKTFKFEAAHIVRNCTSSRCSHSIHGHSFIVEVFLSRPACEGLDRGGMVYDFGLMKGPIADFLDSFDHATLFWSKDDPGYIAFVKKFSARWVSLPFNTSCEMLSKFFFIVIDKILANTFMTNGDKAAVSAVIVHETATGYAKSSREDAAIADFSIQDVLFSDGIQEEWKNTDWWVNLSLGIPYKNPYVIQQVML